MNITRLRRIILLSCALLSVAVLGMLSSTHADVQSATIDSGTYQGHDSEYADNVTTYEGISFAAAPVRDLRWKPPAPAIPFAGTRHADRMGPACWQPRDGGDTVYARGNLNRSEDCLYLNVYTGAQDSAETLPVLVWFHGGSNTGGHGGARIFDGSNLAERGAVVVTANYRLGPMGFMAHAGLTRESEHNSSGNYGILDQIEVLDWVQRNISQFGGDPSRVTIFGQSAGGTDVCLIMSSPLAQGKVHGVIGQSPGCIKMTTQLDGAQNSGHSRGEAFARAMGITGSGESAVEQLREISPQQLIATMSTPGAGTAPVIDGWVVPAAPYDQMQSSSQNKINIMVGGLADEYHGLQSGSPEITEAELGSYIDRVFGDNAAAVKTAYADMDEASPLDVRKNISTDNGFLLSSRMWARLVEARGNDAYVYFFSRKAPAFRLYTPANPDLNNDGGQRTLGAYHSGELAYVFDNLDVVGIGWDADDHALSETIADYWVNFAATGNPNGAGLPNWPAYDAEQDVVQILDSTVRSAEHPRKAKLDTLESIYLDGR